MAIDKQVSGANSFTTQYGSANKVANYGLTILNWGKLFDIIGILYPFKGYTYIMAIYLSIYLPTPHTYLPTFLPACLPTYILYLPCIYRKPQVNHNFWDNFHLGKRAAEAQQGLDVQRPQALWQGLAEQLRQRRLGPW